MSARQGIALRVLASAEAKKSNKAAQLPDNLVRIGLRRSQLSSLQSVLLLPIFDADNAPVAIVRLLNHESGRGFSRQDSESLTAISPTLMPILQTVQTLSQSLNRPAA
jgi:hypothetical protein